MPDLEFIKVNEVYLKVRCNEGIARELSAEFSFQGPTWKKPKWAGKDWDGRIKLFDLRGNRIYRGLLDKIIAWADKQKYTHDWEFPCNAMNPAAIAEWANKTAPPDKPLFEDQQELLCQAVHANRGTIISPTGSGKSLIAYMLVRWYKTKTLIIVGTKNQCNQYARHFAEYGVPDIHQVYDYAGMVPATDQQVTVATWQTLLNLPKTFFDGFGLVIGDEAHTFKAASLVQIMTSLTQTPYRFGMTATLANKDAKVHALTIEGLFGPIIKGRTTAQLIENKRLATVDIYCVILRYPEEVRKKFRAASFNEEVDFLVSYPPRQRYICNLASALKGSTFVLFRLVEKHGAELYQLIESRKPGKTHIVWHDTETDVREAVRLTADADADTTVVASSGIFSTAVDVPNLANAIFAHSFKGWTQILQSIGRTLRVTPTKKSATIYDIVDDLSWGDRQNYGVRHYLERLRLYYREFPNMKVKLITVDL